MTPHNRILIATLITLCGSLRAAEPPPLDPAAIAADCDFEAIIIPVTVQSDSQQRTLTVKLADNPTCRGAMKQLRLRLPAADGTAEVRRIELRR